jgi:hypothetical protein
LTAQPAVAATFTVTSTQCEGAGSITEAMDTANNTPGEDTITFTPGLRVDAGTCPTDTICASPDPRDCFFLQAEESVIFDGQNATIAGAISWFDTSGINQAGKRCTTPLDLIVAQTPGFIKVGFKAQSNAGIAVTIRDLHMEELAAVATIEQDASLVIEDSTFRRIWALPQPNCSQPAVIAWQGASFKASGTEWFWIWNDLEPLAGIAYNAAIEGNNAGDLAIESSEFTLVLDSGVVVWEAPAGTDVNIVSSRFDSTGGIVFAGGATGNIVNSIWSTPESESRSEDRIVNISTGEMNIIASTLLFATADCDSDCADAQGEEQRGLVHRTPDGGTINLIGTAIGVTFPDVPDPTNGYKEVLDPDTSDPTPPAFGFSADANTWIQPTGVNTPATGGQDAATLQAVTNQPLLRTDPPGLRTSPDVVLGQVARAEPLDQLLDRIENSACGQDNELINPIDRTCITEDALGNPRVDGNGSRNIGAVQLNEAPHLSVLAVGDGTVNLAWTKPQDLTGSFTGYVLFYRPTGGSFAQVFIQGPDTLTYQVTGLTNGTEYEFLIDSFVDGAIGGFASNVVTATPLGTLQAPSVTATASVCQTLVSWAEPDTGGFTISDYLVQHRAVGDIAWYTDMVPASELEKNVIGLSAETDYEFRVIALASDGTASAPGTAQATTTKSGDIDVSGTVTYNVDRPLFLASNGSSQGDANYEPNADLDCDGRVTPADYRLWYKAWIADGRVR